MHLIVICDGLRIEAVASPLFLNFTIAYKECNNTFKTHKNEAVFNMICFRLQRELECLRSEQTDQLTRNTVQEVYETFIHQLSQHYAQSTKSISA